MARGDMRGVEVADAAATSLLKSSAEARTGWSRATKAPSCRLGGQLQSQQANGAHHIRVGLDVR
eukprot:scaffold291567_cov28-Tisochrysis_lutea.AAC.3